MTKTTLTTSFKLTRSLWLLLIVSLTFGTVAFAQPPTTQPAAPVTQPAAPASQPVAQPATAQPTPAQPQPAPPKLTAQGIPEGAILVDPPAAPRRKPTPRKIDTTRAVAPATALGVPATDTARALTTATAVRVDTPKVADPSVPVLSASDNPFDILRGGSKTDSASKAEAAKSNIENNGSDPIRLVFWVWLLVFLLLALVSITSGHIISQVYRSLANDSSLRLIYKGYSGWGNFAYITLYFICWMNLAIFAYLMLHRYKGSLGLSPGMTFLVCFAGVAVFFLIKHFFLYVLSTVFPLEKEIRLYNFIVMSAGILTGLVLTPLNIFMAYSPAPLSTTFMYMGIASFVIIFLLRAFRGLFVGANYLTTHPFHFLLYLCTAEIAPMAVLAKLVLLKSGI